MASFQTTLKSEMKSYRDVVVEKGSSISSHTIASHKRGQKSCTLKDIYMIDISAVSKKAPNFAQQIKLGIFHFEIVEQTETINSSIIKSNIT